jgi:hypothetical protein
MDTACSDQSRPDAADSALEHGENGACEATGARPAQPGRAAVLETAMGATAKRW